MRRAVAMLALALLTACGGASQAAGPTPSPSPSSSPSSSASGSPGLVFPIDGKKYGTSATGTLTLTNLPGPGFFLDVKVSGLAADSNHVSHIHSGSCQQPGLILFALRPVVADATGVAEARSQVNATYPPKSGHWYVVIHAGPDMQGSNATYLLCGNLF
jgi:hypothetical protein